MNIEKRLKFLNTEKAKILGFARSHLRNVELARRFESEVDKKIRKLKMDIGTPQALHYYLWKEIRELCDDWLRKEHYQLRVFDDGTIELLDQAFIKRPGGFIEEQIREIGQALTCFPEKARAVLQLHYQKGLSCEEISRQITVPVDEVYQLWQHAIIFLWEGAQEGEGQGFQEKEDEAFWTLGLRYLDGSASEKFVAELNSEIHVNQSRMKEYNDLRIIDGVMIAFGASDQWPSSKLIAAAKPGQPVPVAVERKKKKVKAPREKKDYAIGDTIRSQGMAALASGKDLLGTGFGKFRKALMPPSEQEATSPGKNGSGKSKTALLSKKVPLDNTRGGVQLGDSPEFGKNVLGTGFERLKEALLPPSGPGKTGNAKNKVAILSKGDPDDATRRGIHLDDSPVARKVAKKIDPLLQKQLMVLAAVGLGVILLSIIFSKVGDFFSFGSGDTSNILRSTPLEFSQGKIGGGKAIKSGNYVMSSGTMHFHTSHGIGIIIEAPATFSIKSPRHISLKQGRLVALVPENAPRGIKLATDQFKFTSPGGEIGIVVDDQSSDVIVFSGEGKLDPGGKTIAPGTGLRFFETGDPEVIESRTEAHRFPDLIPMTSPKAYGDNLIVNQSFEIGTLSRSCKIERLYRDIPSGWTAGWQKDGLLSNALEQHSGTVRITGPIGGLPAPVHGERYLWINHGFVGQELPDLKPGVTYTLSVQVASHRNIGPGSNQMIENVGGNTFRFGIWSGSEWISQTSGQLRSGQPFQEMKMDFKLPETKIPGNKPTLMLTGETRIFYDDIVLRKKEEK